MHASYPRSSHPVSTLTGLLAIRAAEFPDAPALIERERVVSYADLDLESRRIARALSDFGVTRGTRVAIWLPNVSAWFAVFFACTRLGAIAVSVNTRFKSHELEDIVGRSRCRALIYWPGFRHIDFTAILAGCEPQALSQLDTLIAYDESNAAYAAHPPAAGDVIGRNSVAYRRLLDCTQLDDDRATPDAGCVMFTTSGTTKAPKFVLHDQGTIVGHAHDVAKGFGYTAPDARILITAPLCGVFGFCNAMAAFAAARPLVMYPTFDAVESAAAIRRHRVTHTNCTDDMISQMLAAVPETPAFPSAHFFGYAAFSPAQADLPTRAEARGLKVVGLYGSSELQALLARQDETLPLAARVPGGGKPVSAKLRVRARDPESQVIQPHGTPGELEFLAPSAMAGYFENDAATAAASTADGWFKSGDFGHTTEDGGFVFIARLGDAIRLSGFLVSPAEIEDVLQAHAAVAAAQVVGAATPDGVKPVAFVIVKTGASFDEAALIAHCKGLIAGFKVPARIAALDAFPVTPGANATKIQKSRLRELAHALVTE